MVKKNRKQRGGIITTAQQQEEENEEKRIDSLVIEKEAAAAAAAVVKMTNEAVGMDKTRVGAEEAKAAENAQEAAQVAVKNLEEVAHSCKDGTGSEAEQLNYIAEQAENELKQNAAKLNEISHNKVKDEPEDKEGWVKLNTLSYNTAKDALDVHSANLMAIISLCIKRFYEKRNAHLLGY
jgi:hypothetical protein